MSLSPNSAQAADRRRAECAAAQLHTVCAMAGASTWASALAAAGFQDPLALARATGAAELRANAASTADPATALLDKIEAAVAAATTAEAPRVLPARDHANFAGTVHTILVDIHADMAQLRQQQLEAARSVGTKASPIKKSTTSSSEGDANREYKLTSERREQLFDNQATAWGEPLPVLERCAHEGIEAVYAKARLHQGRQFPGFKTTKWSREKSGPLLSRKADGTYADYTTAPSDGEPPRWRLLSENDVVWDTVAIGWSFDSDDAQFRGRLKPTDGDGYCLGGRMARRRTTSASTSARAAPFPSGCATRASSAVPARSKPTSSASGFTMMRASSSTTTRSSR